MQALEELRREGIRFHCNAALIELPSGRCRCEPFMLCAGSGFSDCRSDVDREKKTCSDARPMASNRVARRRAADSSFRAAFGTPVVMTDSSFTTGLVSEVAYNPVTNQALLGIQAIGNPFVARLEPVPQRSGRRHGSERPRWLRAT
jgi:hypothetical protein